MPAIDCTRYFPPGNSGTSAYRQRESADGLSFLLHPRFSGVWFFSFDSMCGIVNLYSVRGRKPSVVCPCFLISNEFPARGRKRKARFIKRKHIELQFLPARGRKRVKCFVVHTHTQTLQFIPVRGRKQAALAAITPLPDCNLSPQGDENISAAIPRIW